MSITNLFTSSLGKKFIMAATGLALFLFVLLHLLGNLQVFLGPDVINRYGNFLQTNLELVWPARIGLLVIVLLHIWAAVKLSAENRAARPQPYAQYEVVAASYASRTMLMSGLIILAFIIYHLLHFTVQLQALNLTGRSFAKLEDAKKQHDIFAMMVLGFRNPVVSAFYIVAMFLLFLHLSHGLSAMFQSLGWKSPAYGPFINRFATVVSWFLFLGYASIPIAILLGYGGNYLAERGLLK
ncbi:MAG: succinate:quinone oxidoreductase [Pedosphaera sp.]|nr:succinate:quinone oxidoreductase [Pedosphaera sp.]